MLKRIFLSLCALLMLTGCTAVPGSSANGPDLRLLRPLPYQEDVPAVQTVSSSASLRMDLWLDASQTMGGINASGDSLYPHFSRKYREGGFHYRYENTVGWYETVLRCMLSAVEGSRVRLLRCGNERLPDVFLQAQGLAASHAGQDTLRSLRRDLLTVAIDPEPTVFSRFSAENMSDSFYSLGSSMLNQLDQIDARLLENSAQTESLSNALDRQIAAIAAGTDSSLVADSTGEDYPLLYALNNLDLSRLSVITCDPASIGKLSAVSLEGEAVNLLTRLLVQRGVFDAGLCVGVYAFTLDYLGQLSSFGTASLAEPLVWGQLKYDSRLHQSVGVMPMPRTLLTLVIGTPGQVEDFTTALNTQLDAAPALQELRGPDNGQLTYTQNGRTVTHQPFSFGWEYTCIRRPSMGCFTQYTPDTSLSASRGTVSRQGSLQTVTLSPASQPAALTFTLPLSALPDGVSANLDSLANLTIAVDGALVLTQILPNSAEAELPKDAQIIAHRDKLYVFTQQAGDEAASAFCLQQVRKSADGKSLQIILDAESSGLQPGDYRLCVSADFFAGQFSWNTPPWVSRLSATLTAEQVSAWEAFSRLIRKYDGGSANVPRQFQHAWGPATERSYHGDAIPDIPPLTLAPSLEALVCQLQEAAAQGESPFLRYVFDVFVLGDDRL